MFGTFSNAFQAANIVGNLMELLADSIKSDSKFRKYGKTVSHDCFFTFPFTRGEISGLVFKAPTIDITDGFGHHNQPRFTLIYADNDNGDLVLVKGNRDVFPQDFSVNELTDNFTYLTCDDFVLAAEIALKYLYFVEE